jgi:hypothetical protein
MRLTPTSEISGDMYLWKMSESDMTRDVKFDAQICMTVDSEYDCSPDIRIISI